MESQFSGFNYLLVSLSRQIRSMVKTEMNDTELTFEQIRAISYIDRFKGCSQKQLADLLEMKPMSTTKIVSFLDGKGYVERKVDPSDKRAFKLYLTPTGKAQTKDIKKISKRVFSLISKGLSDAEIEGFYNLMKKIEDNIVNVRTQKD